MLRSEARADHRPRRLLRFPPRSEEIPEAPTLRRSCSITRYPLAARRVGQILDLFILAPSAGVYRNPRAIIADDFVIDLDAAHGGKGHGISSRLQRGALFVKRAIAVLYILRNECLVPTATNFGDTVIHDAGVGVPIMAAGTEPEDDQRFFAGGFEPVIGTGRQQNAVIAFQDVRSSPRGP